MFHRCTMTACHYAHKPHGYLIGAITVRGFRRAVFPLGLALSCREARALTRVCVERGVISQKLEYIIDLQLALSDLPEECEWDDVFEEDVRRVRTLEEFIDYFSYAHIRHTARPEVIAASNRDKKALFEHRVKPKIIETLPE